jgi:hypothetical protein
MRYVLFAFLYSYSNAAQFGYQYPVLYGKPISGLEYLIEETIQAPDDDPMSALKPASVLQAALAGTNCLDWEPSRVVANNLGLPFEWIWCTMIPYAMLQSSASSLFGLISMSEGQPRINDPMCQRGFGINSIDAGPAYEKELGVDTETLKNTERLVLWYGGNDAVSSIGSIQSLWEPSGNTAASQIVFATDAGHTQEQQRSRANDTAALNSTRHFERQSIKQWLNMV